MSLLRKTRRDGERFYFDSARNVSRGRSAVTESTRDPFHPLTSTTTCTAGDNGLQTGWISIPTPEAAGDPGRGLEPATGDPLRCIDRPIYLYVNLYIRQTLRRRVSRSEAHQGDVYSYGLHVSVNPAQTPLLSCFGRRCVHAQPCVTGAAAAAAGRVRSHTNPGQAARRTSHGEFAMPWGPCGGDWHGVRDSKR